MDLLSASCKLMLSASCKLRVDSEKCELVHLECELRVPKITTNFHLL